MRKKGYVFDMAAGIMSANVIAKERALDRDCGNLGETPSAIASEAGSPMKSCRGASFHGAGYVRNEVSACRLAKWRPACNVTPASLSIITRTWQSWWSLKKIAASQPSVAPRNDKKGASAVIANPEGVKQSWFGPKVDKTLKRTKCTGSHASPQLGEFALQVQGDEKGKCGKTNDVMRHAELVSASYRHLATPRSKFAAFTLAEALITLAIIGVIAAVALPIVVTNVQNKVRAEQIRTAKYKFTKATDLMNLNGKIGPYYGATADFVEELGNYLKIAKICDNSHLSDCFGYDEINLGDETFEINKIKTGATMKMPKNDSSDYTSENIGIITLDGTSMILSWNTKCAELNQGQIYGWTIENGKPVSNATAGCVAAVMDINGNGKPNTLNKDIALFNANGIGSNCVIELPSGTCLGAIFTPTPLTYDECEARKGELGIQNCCTATGCYSNGDYWAGAVAQCGGVDKMPTMANLAEIVSMIYVGNPTVGAKEEIRGLTYVFGTATQFGLPEPPNFYLWSGEMISVADAYSRTFTRSNSYQGDTIRYHSDIQAACLAD